MPGRLYMTTEYDAFAATYDLEYGAFEGDLDFYVELAKDAEPPVLELATGTGRVSPNSASRPKFMGPAFSS